MLNFFILQHYFNDNYAHKFSNCNVMGKKNIYLNFKVFLSYGSICCTAANVC